MNKKLFSFLMVGMVAGALCTSCSKDDGDNGEEKRPQSIFPNNIKFKTITTTAGMLSKQLSEEEIDTLKALRIKGSLNGNDITLLSRMGGKENQGNLVYLDMGGAEIEEGIIINRAFKQCHNLKIIQLPYNLISLGNTNFESAMGVFHECENLEKIGIPNTLKTIGRGTFSGCISLESITLPKSIKVIGSNAFDGCKGLTHIELPDSIIEIEIETFRYCNSLESITIPSGVTIIGNLAFQDCQQLSAIYLHTTVPPTAHHSFTSYTATLYVPIGCVDVYTNAVEWKQFSNIVEGNYN